MSDFYLVRKGDNLTKIARKYNTSVKELLKLNPNLKNGGNLIFVGDKINLPFKNVEDIDMNVKGLSIEKTAPKAEQKTEPKTEPSKLLQEPPKLKNYATVKDSLTVKVNKNFDVRTPFLGTAEDLEVVIGNTPLKGQGKNFLAAQEKYGVNALFMVAISRTESSFGKHVPKGNNKGNFAGLKRLGNIRTFEECIDKLANNFANGTYYYKRNKTTIGQIAPTYCDTAWGTATTRYMDAAREQILKANYAG